jgi:hypothetical protein
VQSRGAGGSNTRPHGSAHDDRGLLPSWSRFLEQTALPAGSLARETLGANQTLAKPHRHRAPLGRRCRLRWWWQHPAVKDGGSRGSTLGCSFLRGDGHHAVVQGGVVAVQGRHAGSHRGGA